MKNKWVRRVLSGMLLLALVLSCTSPASAVVPLPGGSEARTYLAGTANYPTIYAVMIAYERDDHRNPIITTQAEHKVGAKTVITLERGYGYELSAAASLEVSVGGELEAGIEGLATAAFNGSLAVQLGVSASASFTTTSTITYEFDDTAPAGFYRMVEVYPVKALTLRVIGYDENGSSKILGQKTIAYAPRLSGAYISWETYDPYAE